MPVQQIIDPCLEDVLPADIPIEGQVPNPVPGYPADLAIGRGFNRVIGIGENSGHLAVLGGQ